MKSYAAAGQAFLLLLILPGYGFLASRVNPIKLINWVTTCFIANLVAFYFLAQCQMRIAVPFFLWVGAFNLLVTAQWSLAYDLYSREQGERLFPIVAFGGALGAILGPMVAGSLFRRLGPYDLMLVAASLLGICILLTYIVSRWKGRLARVAARRNAIEIPVSKEGGFRLILRHRYLLCIGLLMVVLNLVNTTGEFILSKTVTAEAHQVIAKQEERAANGADLELTSAQREKMAQEFIGKFYGNFFFWVSLVSAVVQLLFVSRMVKQLGASGALFFLPLIALGAYSLIALVPRLICIQVAKILENGTGYSLQYTTGHVLFLPTGRGVQYKAKAVIDTFFVRLGDVFSAGIVSAGSYLLFDIRAFALINAALIVFWLALVVTIGRRYKEINSTVRV